MKDNRAKESEARASEEEGSAEVDLTDSIDELALKFDQMTTVANLGTKNSPPLTTSKETEVLQDGPSSLDEVADQLLNKEEEVVTTTTLTYKKFRESIIERIALAKQTAMKIFTSNTKDLESANQAIHVTIDSIEFNFRLIGLNDGGVMVSAKARSLKNASAAADLFALSCVFLEKPNVLDGRLAMADALKLLPEFVDCSTFCPVSEFSLKYLKNRFLFPNDRLVGRFENYSLFCRLCERHVSTTNSVLEHIRSKDHRLLHTRFYDRYQMYNFQCYSMPNPTQIYAELMHNIKASLSQQLIQMYTRCDRGQLNRAFERLENFVQGYSIQFYLFGSYQSSLMLGSNEWIDCYVEITKVDGTIPSYEEKKNVFFSLPFKIQTRYETAFSGYIAEWDTRAFREYFFFTFDAKAKDSVLSSHLMALYNFVFPSIMQLQLVFRLWANCCDIFKPGNEFRVSGAIFDYMVLHFMQKCVGIPIINDETVGCPLKDFLKKPTKYQILKTKPMFEAFAEENAPQSIDRLFIDLILFYGCGFNYQNCVQVVSNENCPKNNWGLRSVKITDPVTPTINLFNMRPEQAYHFDNMIFIGCCEFLQTLYTNNFKNIAVDFISGTTSQGYHYLVLTEDPSLISGLGNTFRGGTGMWNSASTVPRFTVKCQFCRMPGHSENFCTQIMLESMDRLPPIQAGIQDILSNVIQRYYSNEQITSEHVQNAEQFVSQLETIVLKHANISIKIQPFGSLKSGFGTKRSDLDLCIMLLDDTKDHNNIEKERFELLRSVGNALLSDGGFEIRQVFGAKVPILTFKFTKGDKVVKGDICYANELALYNTKMLLRYSSFDRRVPPLGIAIKKWAQAFEINNSALHTFSSYALVIMLIHFLQRVQPPILPYLQDTDEFNLTKEVYDNYEVQFARPSKDYVKKFCRNTMSPGELFTAFFDYYGAFDWKEEVVQIRSPKSLYKVDKEWNREIMAIEDPFDLSHNLVGGIRRQNALYILKLINIMQREFRCERSIFFEQNFNFDSEEFKCLKATFNGQENGGMSCYKCGKTGHRKNQCTGKNNTRPKDRKK